MSLSVFSKWLPHVDSHHDDRRNRPTGYFTSRGNQNMVDEDGNAPSPAECESAVRLVHYKPMMMF